MDKLLQLALTSPTAALGLAMFVFAVVGSGTFLFLRKLHTDIDGIGRKVGAISTQQQLDNARMGRHEATHEKLEAWYLQSQKELPDLLKAARHEVIAHLSGSIQSIDDRADQLHQDVRDLRLGVGVRP